MDVVVYGNEAENVATSFRRGHRAVVTSRLRHERWETYSEKHSRVRIVANEVASSTRFATMTVAKVERQQSAEEASRSQSNASREQR